MYSLIFTWIVGSMKNKNSVLPISIKKNFEQKIYSCLLKMVSLFCKEGKSNFFDLTWIEITEIIFSTSCKKLKIFFIFFEKRRLAQGIRRPKAADSRLLKITVTWTYKRILTSTQFLITSVEEISISFVFNFPSTNDRNLSHDTHINL